MIYMKHPVLGNRHVDDAEQAEREAAGWVRWPRTKAQKEGAPNNAAPQEQPEVAVSPGNPTPAPDGAAPVKRKPGRPAKVKP